MALKSYFATLSLLLLLAFNLIANNPLQTRINAKHFVPNQRINHQSGIEYFSQHFGLNKYDFVIKHKSYTDIANNTHQRYSLSFAGLPIIGSEVTVHSRNGGVIDYTSNLYTDNIINLDTKYSEYEATSIARFSTNRNSLIVDNLELCLIDQAFPNFSGKLTKTYAITLADSSGFFRSKYYVSAQDGCVIFSENLVCETAVHSKGQTLYYGEQEFVVDSISPNQFMLSDTTRGDGILTYTDIDRSNGNGFALVENDTNYWDLREVHNASCAVDAHFLSSKFYDILLEKFNWEGLDGSGLALKSLVNYQSGRAYVNAFWNGQRATFGDGDCHRGPLTTADVVAHEFTHGLTDFTSDLIYQNESGALNESMSDIFGKATEYFLFPNNFTWLIGQDFILSDYANPLRNMANPNEFGDPKYYKGKSWFTGESDNGGVHTNSGVMNHWFYLLVTGGTVVTEKMDTVTIDGLGMETAIQIPFLMQTSYLTTTSDYKDAFAASIYATNVLYGEESNELTSVKNAWKAVGLSPAIKTTNRELAIEFDNLELAYCIKDSLVDIPLRIINNGLDTVFADEPLFISFNNDTTEIFSPSDILPTDTFFYTFSEKYRLLIEGRHRLELNLLDKDKYLGNNRAIRYITNYHEEDIDFGITASVSSSLDCYLHYLPVMVKLSNSSCNTIPAGTTYNLIGYHEDQVFKDTTLTLLSDLGVGRSINHTLPFEPVNDIDIIDVKLVCADDTSPTNDNADFIVITVPKSIRQEYFNDFTEENDKNRQLELEDINKFAIVEYEGKKYLANSGNTNDVYNICSYNEDNFITDGATFAEFCIDFSKYENVKFSFDLVQLKNRHIDSLTSIANGFTMTRVTWVDINGTKYSQLINDQPEGEIVKHTLDLPNQFRGYIRFDLYSHLGSEGSFYNLDDYDYNLLSNLSITGDLISNITEPPTNTNHLNIYPNPVTNNVLHFEFDTKAERIINVYDLAGNTISSLMVNDSTYYYQFGNNLSNGVYIVKVTNTATNEISLGRLVVN